MILNAIRYSRCWMDNLFINITSLWLSAKVEPFFCIKISVHLDFKLAFSNPPAHCWQYCQSLSVLLIHYFLFAFCKLSKWFNCIDGLKLAHFFLFSVKFQLLFDHVFHFLFVVWTFIVNIYAYSKRLNTLRSPCTCFRCTIRILFDWIEAFFPNIFILIQKIRFTIGSFYSWSQATW